MSDYMFMLESHLTGDQNRALAAVQAVASAHDVNLFLTGGAMRDVLGGFPVRDLDFTVEGPALKLARELAAGAGAVLLRTSENRKTAELRFPGPVTVSVSMARRERYSKPGARPQVTSSTIHEDLRQRDFTIDAVALSLSRASRGLLLDPTNGLGDLARKEIRTVYSSALFDDPGRLLRLVWFRQRFGFAVEERTAQQFRAALEAGLEKLVTPRALYDLLAGIALEPAPAEVLRLLDEEKLLHLVSPALCGSGLPSASLARLQKARQLLPVGLPYPVDHLALLLAALADRMTPREKAALNQTLGLSKPEIDNWSRLPARARKVEDALSSSGLQKASQVYRALIHAPGEQALYTFLHTGQRTVQDRIRNFFSKYLLTAQEVSGQELESEGLAPGSPKFLKRKAELIDARLDVRPRKPAPPAEEEPAMALTRGRR